MHALQNSRFTRRGGHSRTQALYRIGGVIALLMLMLSGGPPRQAAAQESGGDVALTLREPGADSAASSVRLAVTPEEEVPVMMRLIAGDSFGTDTVAVEAWNGSSFEALTTNGLLDPETNLITPEGIDLTFDGDGVLFAALNREFPDEGAGEARTLITRFDAGGWVQVGQPVGRGITLGPLYLFDAQPGLTLISLELGTELSELHARSLDAGEWLALEAPVLNIDPEADAVTLFAAAAGGLPIMAWVEYTFFDDVNFAYADFWDQDSFAAMGEVPLVQDIEIDVVQLAGLAGGPGGEVYLATVEDFGDLLFYEVWRSEPPFEDNDWESLGLPFEAEESPCAEAHAIAAGPEGEVYYAWAEPCLGRILVAVSLGDGDWFTLDAEVAIDAVMPGVPLEMAVGPEGVVYVAWIAPQSGVNGAVGVAAFLPG